MHDGFKMPSWHAMQTALASRNDVHSPISQVARRAPSLPPSTGIQLQQQHLAAATVAEISRVEAARADAEQKLKLEEHAIAQMRKEAARNIDVAVEEAERKAFSAAARLRVNLNWSEDERKKLVWQINHLRDSQAKAVHLEQVNSLLSTELHEERARSAAFASSLAERSTHEEVELLREEIQNLQDLNAKLQLQMQDLEDVSRTAASQADAHAEMAEEHGRMREHVARVNARQDKITQLEKSNAYLRLQLRQQKALLQGQPTGSKTAGAASSQRSPQSPISPTSRRGRSSGRGGGRGLSEQRRLTAFTPVRSDGTDTLEGDGQVSSERWMFPSDIGTFPHSDADIRSAASQS